MKRQACAGSGLTLPTQVHLNGSIPTSVVQMISLETPMCVGRVRDTFYETGHVPYDVTSANTPGATDMKTVSVSQVFEDSDGERTWTGDYAGEDGRGAAHATALLTQPPSQPPALTASPSSTTATACTRAASRPASSPGTAQMCRRSRRPSTRPQAPSTLRSAPASRRAPPLRLSFRPSRPCRAAWQLMMASACPLDGCPSAASVGSMHGRGWDPVRR